MEIPGWLKGLTPKKIAPDSPPVSAEASGQPAETGAIPAPDATRVMGEEETVADDLRAVDAPLPDMEAPVVDNLNVSTDKLPDWLIPGASAVSAPLPDAKDQVIEGTAVAAPDAPVIDEHFFGQTSEEIQAEKARKRAEFAAEAVSTPEAPIKTTMEEDLTAKGFKETPFPESDGSQTWVNQGGETVRQAKFEETGLESEFDEGLKAAGSLQEVAALMEKKLEELESSATEGSRAVEKLETERDQLTRESAAVQKYASRHLPSSRSKDRFAQAERVNLIAARTRYREIQARLTQINGGAETTGELALVKQNLTKEELTTEARRLRQIQQTRGELEKWDTLAEQPFLYERYRELAHQKAEAEKNFAPSVASLVNESATEEMDSLEQVLPRRLLEMEGLMPERGRGPEVSLDTSEETFAYNRALNRFRELLGPATEAYRQNATPPETESVSAPTTESADDAQQTIIDLKARVAQLEAELAKKAPSPAETAAETPAQPEVELLDQIRERAENRKNNFASAVAQLEGAYMDTAGTKNERVGRVVEGVREMILAGLELAEEGGPAQEVVMNVLGRLNNEQNRPLVRAAAGQAPEQVDRAVGEMLQARGAFGPDGKPKSRKELENSGLVGLIELLLELGMSFTDASVNAVITEVQSATGAGR